MFNFTDEEIQKYTAYYNRMLSELENLNLQLESQKEKKQILVVCANNLTDKIDVIEKNTNSKELLSVLESLKDCIGNISINIDSLNSLSKALKTLIARINAVSSQEELTTILVDLETYNIHSAQKQKQILENNLKIEKFIQESYKYINVNNANTKSNSAPSVTSYGENISSNSVLSEDDIITDNNVLLISEKKAQVILPYKVEDLEKILKSSKNKYKNLRDLINENYVIPLEKYKNSSVARFREAFNLMKRKEKSSFLKALEIAFELMFKYELHPAIISACKNSDELDVYLDCLYEEELELFKIFEIKYDYLPVKRKKNERFLETVLFSLFTSGASSTYSFYSIS